MPGVPDDKQVDELQVLPGEPRKMLTEAEVLDLIRVGRTTLYNLIKIGAFPPGVYVSSNRRLWFADKIAAWQKALDATNPNYNPNRGRGKGRRPRVAAIAPLPRPNTS
jgi:predicted DNA-binding transcriptional regulator AlpA